MTLYRESMRRLSRTAVTLMALTFIASLICAIIGGGNSTVFMTSAVEMSPVLAVYAFVGGAGLAFAGFSFLNKRVESDFYHSIPVKRADLFLSVTAAAATWMLFTVVLSAATSVVVYLALGRPFAPLYPFMNAGYFFSAALLVFAAAAIGCTITGTWFTNVILTGLVLFLPRYILFMIGRTLIADTGMMSWLDLRGFLDPTTNAATGVVVMLSRPMLMGKLVNGVGIIWSLVLALIELGAGALLFKRRPSELAEQGASNRILQIVFACLLSLTVLLVFTVRANQATGIFLCIILVAAFACYAVYQIIVLRSARRVLLSLPWFLCSVAVSAAILFGAQAAARKALNVCPSSGEIASVRFLGNDRGRSPVSYATILTERIEFTEESVKGYVADTLRQNIDSVYTYGYLYTDSNFSCVEPVCIRLQNGRTLYRVLMFSDSKALLDCRRDNEEYCHAVLQLPPDDTVKAVSGYIDSRTSEGRSPLNFDSPELYALCEYYFGEQRAAGDIIPYYTHAPSRYRVFVDSRRNAYYNYTPVNEEQNCGGFDIGGYIGTTRYHDNVTITLQTPATASYYMRLRNRYAGNADPVRLRDMYAVARSSRFETEGMYYSVGIEIMNCPNADGDRQWASLDWYINLGDDYDSPHQYPEFKPLMDELVDILARGTLTEDCTRLCVVPHYDIVWADGSSEYISGSYYLGFSPADEARLLEIVGAWSVMTEARYSVMGHSDAVREEAPDTMLPVPTPTPVPVG